MATDFSKPVVTDAYATLLPGLVTANKDLAMMLEPTLTGTSTNVPTGAVRWNATTICWERWSGSAWVTLPAAGNNIYDISISGNAATASSATTAAACSGNAATATKLATAHTIGGVSFDGSAAINLPGVNTVGNQNTTGNAATATTASACSGNAATATTAGSCSGNAASATLAAKASTLSQGGGNGSAMTFNWSGQSGQPSWLWGSNDGSNINVYNPSNFSVAYAATAGNGGVTSVNGQTGVVTVSSTPTTAQVTTATAGASVGQVGTYALLRYSSASALSPGATVAGSSLNYANTGGTASGSVPSGTWRLCGEITAFDVSTRTSLWLRIA